MHVGLALYPGCIPSGLFAASDLLEAANQLSGERYFHTTWVSDPEHLYKGISSSFSPHMSGPSLVPEKSIHDIDLDVLLLPGMWIRSIQELEQNLEQNQGLTNTLSKLDDNTTLHGYCSSVSFLALTGRINALPATSTWWLADYYRRQFPTVNWDFGKTFIEGSTFSSASGVNGYLPTAMHLVEKNLGPQVLREVSKVMLLPRPEPVQQPFQKVELMSLNDPFMRRIRQWVEAKPVSDISAPRLAQAMNISERTLARRIKATTGESTISFVRLIKLNQASEALIMSKDPIQSISDKAGYEDDRTFRRAFKKVTGYTPGTYRDTFKRPSLT